MMQRVNIKMSIPLELCTDAIPIQISGEYFIEIGNEVAKIYMRPYQILNR